MEWNSNALSKCDWEIEISKSLAVSSHKNGDNSFSSFFNSSCKHRNEVAEFGYTDIVQLDSPSVKRCNVSYQSSDVAQCQVEGCNLDLGSAKDYHRKHRICAHHSKSQKVVVAGMERRFCQQCSRLHDLSEFDERKRSCRRRLSAHNARRRRPQSKDIKFGSTYRRGHMGFVVNRVMTSLSPNSTPQSSSTLNDGGFDTMSNGVLSNISLSFHGVAINNNGVEANCNSVYNTMDFGHSFSLAPTSSWGSSGCNEPFPLDQFIHGHNIVQFGTPLEMHNIIHNPQIPAHDFKCFCSD